MTTTDLPRLDPSGACAPGSSKVGYYQAGPADGDPVLPLPHGFTHDSHS